MKARQLPSRSRPRGTNLLKFRDDGYMSREQDQYTGNKDSGNPEGLLTSVWDVRALMSEKQPHVVGNLVMGEPEGQGSDEKKERL